MTDWVEVGREKAALYIPCWEGGMCGREPPDLCPGHSPCGSSFAVGFEMNFYQRPLCLHDPEVGVRAASGTSRGSTLTACLEQNVFEIFSFSELYFRNSFELCLLLAKVSF